MSPSLAAKAGLACTLALALATGCRFRDEAPPGSVLNIAHDEDVQTWDPAIAYDEASLDVLSSIYETLYQYDYLSEDYRLVPLLASDPPSFSADRRTATIQIRSGVRFQADPCFGPPGAPGRELTADDFVFGLKRLALPGLHSHGWKLLSERLEGMKELKLALGKTPPAKRLALLLKTPVAGVHAENRYTLNLRLKAPLPQLRYLLALSFTAPIAPEAARFYADPDGSLPSHPVGTGPFRLKDWRPGARVVLERNHDHHSEFYPGESSNDFRNRGWLADSGKAIPFLDNVIFDIFRDKGLAWQAFQQGKIDALRIPRDNLTGAITNQVNLSPELTAKGVRLSIETGPAFSYLFFNTRNGILAGDKKLRQAISSAIDRDQWIERVEGKKAARKMTSLLPPGFADRPARLAPVFDYNPERARQLLTQAGFPGGRGLPELTLELRGADGFSHLLGEFFVDQLAKVGIRLKFRMRSFDEYLEGVRHGNFQIAYGNWGVDFPDAQNVLSLLSDSSPALKKLYDRISMLEAGPERARLIREMDDVAQEESPWALGYYYSRYVISQPWVLNFRNNGIIINKYKYMRVNPSLKARYLEVK